VADQREYGMRLAVLQHSTLQSSTAHPGLTMKWIKAIQFTVAVASFLLSSGNIHAA
jgi:hypothetical protein